MFHADEVIGEYRLLRQVGDGALGVVWQAQRLDRDELVALKLMHPERVPSTTRKQAFESLTRALTRTGRLDHPNLQALFGLALRDADGVFGIAAKHYEGGAFEHLGNLGRHDTLIKAIILLRQVAEGLAWLHERDLVHGNIKPSNIVVTPGRSGPRPVILDLCWSVAGLGRRTEKTRIFVSPEQLAKQSPTAASDQWATARMMHQLAVRSSPGRSATEALTQLPLPLLRVLKRALEAEPRARFASMSSFLHALEHAQDELGSAGASAPAGLPTPTLEVSVSDALAIREAESRTQVDPNEVVTVEPDPFEEVTFQPEADKLDAARATEMESAPRSEDATPEGFPSVRDAPTEPGMPKPVVRTASEAEAYAAPADPTPQFGLPEAEPAADPTDRIARVTVPAGELAAAPSHDDEADPSAEKADPTTPMSLQAISPMEERGEPSLEPVRPSDPTDVLPAVAAKPSGAPVKALMMMAVALVVIGASGVVLWQNQGESEAPTTIAAVPDKTKSEAKPPPAAPEPAKPAPAKTEPDQAEPKKAEAPPKPAEAPKPVEPPPPAAAQPAPKPVLAAATSPEPAADPLADLREGCEAKRRSDCAQLGQAYLQGKGVSRDIREARKHLGRACDLRLISSCERAGRLYAATGRSYDGRLARRYLERACDAGRGSACAELSKLWASGLGGTANPRTAKAFAARACQLGFSGACE